MPEPTSPLELLPDALARLYDQGIGACLETFPELAPHRSLLLRMRWQEGELTEREIDAENAAELLHRLEASWADGAATCLLCTRTHHLGTT